LRFIAIRILDRLVKATQKAELLQAGMMTKHALAEPSRVPLEPNPANPAVAKQEHQQANTGEAGMG
jgi:hypothetical protein